MKFFNRINLIIVLCIVTLGIVGYTNFFNKHTVNFNTNGGNMINSLTLKSNSVVVLKTPVKSGYTFEGWYLDKDFNKPFNENAMTNNDITLFAKWKSNQYTISFNTNGGNEVTSITKYINNTDFNLPVPTKEGYTFGGWYRDQNLLVPYYYDQKLAYDMTLYAKWFVEPHTITFDSNGGTNIPSMTGDYQEKITEPTQPIKEGYTFDGWYSNSVLSNKYTFDTIPNEDIKLYAKWTFNPSEDLVYQLSDDGTSYKITGYTGEDTSIFVPNYYDNLPVTEIDKLAFFQSQITSIVFENNSVLESIDDMAFVQSSLMSISIPASVTNIGQSSFLMTPNLTAINVSENNEVYSSIDGVLFNKDQLTLIQYPTSKEGTFTIPANVTTISQGAFYNSHIETINIPNRVVTIGDNAFSGSSLSQINFESGSQITTIGSYAFYNTKITSISIPVSVNSIGDYAFQGATNLTSINIDPNNNTYYTDNGVLYNKDQTTLIKYPEGKIGSFIVLSKVITIEDGALNGHILTISFAAGSHLQTIGYGAFCNSDITTLTIPASVTSIGQNAFDNMPNLTQINVDVNNINYYSKDGVLFDKQQFMLMKYPDAKIGSSYTVGDDVYVIDNKAFAFASNLKTITFDSDTPPFIMGNAFNDNLLLYVPYEALDSYVSNFTEWNHIILPYYTISFNTNGGNVMEDLFVKNGDIVLLQSPVKAGYTFDGWYEDENLTQPFNEVISNNHTLYAKWIN